MAKKKIKLLCVQPHSDDVLFSASHFLFDDKYEVEILTIENNTKRVAEDEKLYEFLGIPYHHLKVEFDDQSFYGFHKKYDEVTSQNAVEWLEEFFGEETVGKIREEIVSFIKKFYSKHPDVQIVVPWGVGHPFHIFVRDTIEIATAGKENLWYYRDFPHSYKKRAKSQVVAQLEDYELKESISVAEFHDVKWDLAKKFYKSQSGLLWFEQGYIKKQLPEDIYVKKTVK